MAMFFSNAIPWICFLYGLSNYVFLERLMEGGNIPGLLTFIFGFLAIALPFRICLNKFCSGSVFRHAEITYEKHKNYFFSDYDRENPMTSDDATLAYLEELQKAGEIDASAVT